MKQCLAALFLLLFVPSRCQDAPAPPQPKVIVCDESPACAHQYISGHKYKMLISDKVTAIAAVQNVGKYARVDLFVANDGPNTVDVLPENFILAETLPKDKMLKPVDVMKVIQSAERRMAFANALTAIGANHSQTRATTTTTTTGTVVISGPEGTRRGTYGANSSATTSSPDPAAQARASETIQTRNDAMANVASFASRTVLRANSLATGQSTRGYLVYERDKKAKWVNFGGLIGGTVYMFQLDVSGQ